MNEKYHRLRAEDRKVIRNLREGGSTQAAIAVAIGFSQGTVSKELSRIWGQVSHFNMLSGKLLKMLKCDT